MAQEGGGEWYQSINFNKLSCRQVSVFGPKGTPSREEHKTSGSVLTTFTGALTNWCRKIRQNVSPQEHSKYQGSQRRCSYGIPLQRIATHSIIYFLNFSALQNSTKDGIAFPSHALPIVKCLRRSCAYGDTMIKLYLKANLSLQRNCAYAIGYNSVATRRMYLRYQSVHFYLPRGRLQVWRIFLFNFRPLGTGRVNRVPGFLSSRPNWLPPFTRMRVLPPPPLVPKRGGHTS